MTILPLAAPLLVAGGYLAQRGARRVPRAVPWLLCILGVVGVERMLARESPAARMTAMALLAFLVFKWLVTEEERRDGMPPLPLSRWLAFTLLWVGMRPRLFVPRTRSALPSPRPLLLRGATCLAAGLLLLGAARLAGAGMAGAALLVTALLLCFHFGACTLLAAAWRLCGIPCEPVVRAPTRSRNLAEFWSRRWNLPYSEMCAIALYRPLASKTGRGIATLATFLVSGLLHEIAISVPVGAGFGLPLLYFALHGGLVHLEQELARRGRPVRGLAGRIWTVAWVLGPLPLLFHHPFLTRLLLPMAGVATIG